MLHAVDDWHTVLGTNCVEIPCPVCKRRSLVPMPDLDRDGCVLLSQCGCATVRLVGFALIGPRRVAEGAA